jgi:hypothetical protein
MRGSTTDDDWPASCSLLESEGTMKKESRKLNLVRDTVAPMTPEQLDAVNGGAQSVSVGISKGQSRGISVSTWSVGVSYGESASISIGY